MRSTVSFVDVTIHFLLLSWNKIFTSLRSSHAPCKQSQRTAVLSLCGNCRNDPGCITAFDPTFSLAISEKQAAIFPWWDVLTASELTSHSGSPIFQAACEIRCACFPQSILSSKAMTYTYHLEGPTPAHHLNGGVSMKHMHRTETARVSSLWALHTYGLHPVSFTFWSKVIRI